MVENEAGVSEALVSRETVRMSDGYKLSVTRYRSLDNSRAIAVMNHGIQSHAGWFQATSQDLAKAGFDVWFIDRRGSGLNQWQRGHARGAGRLLEDVRQVVRAAQFAVGDRPVLMAGLCWGGKIAAAAAADCRIRTDALALLYPGIFQRIRGSKLDRFRLNLGRFLGASKRLVPIPLSETLFTDDVTWQRFIRDDELALREISVGSLFAAKDLDQMRNPRSVTCPTIVQLAGNDQIVDNVKITAWAKHIAGGSKTIVYEGVPHVLEFSSTRSKAVKDLVEWADTAFDSG